ncbi:MAG: Ig-like domain-containing protein [Sulfitobacter sp.]
MSKLLAGLSGNAGAVVAGGGMALAIGLGAYIGFGRSEETQTAVPAPAPPAQVPQAEAQPAPEAPQTTEAEQTKETEQTTEAEQTTPNTPKFDELRRETDGTTLIAGRAAPLSEVAIIVDGEEVATTTADSSGGFAAITVLPAKDSAQIVSLSAQDVAGEQSAVPSQDEIILAPTASAAAPEGSEEPQDTAEPQGEPMAQVAVVDPEKDPEPQALETPVQETAPAAIPPKPAEIAVLKSDEDGVRLLNAPSPQAMTSIALDTIGYSEQGDVQLAGRAQPDTARVRVYLDNRSVISLPVDAQGQWEGDLPDVDEGVYTLRVDEVSQSGDVSSRVETPFKRESAQTLAQASEGAEGPVTSITVQTGATLWAIARDRYGDGTLYLRVVEANAADIRNPDLIYPGQVFDLPN